jgi:Phage Single-stranded DNA-binding protein
MKMSEETQAMALPYTGSQLVIPEGWQENHRPGQVVTTIDTSNPVGKLRVMNIMLSKTDSLVDLTDTVIEVQDVTVFTKIVTDEETGEVRNGIHIVLSGPNGEAYSTSSPFVLGDLNKISGFFRPLPWKPPMKLKATLQKSRRKRPFLSLFVVEG